MRKLLAALLIVTYLAAFTPTPALADGLWLPHRSSVYTDDPMQTYTVLVEIFHDGGLRSVARSIPWADFKHHQWDVRYVTYAIAGYVKPTLWKDGLQITQASVGVAPGTQMQLRVTVRSTARNQSDFHNRWHTASLTTGLVLTGHGDDETLNWLRSQLNAFHQRTGDQPKRLAMLGVGAALYFAATDQANRKLATAYGITATRRPSVVLLSDDGTGVSIDVLSAPLRTSGPVYRDRRIFMTQSAATAGLMEQKVLEKITGKISMSAIRALAESTASAPNVDVTPSNADATVPALQLPALDKAHIRNGAERFQVTTVPATFAMPRGFWNGGGWFVHNARNGNSGTYVARTGEIIRQGATVGTADSVAMFSQAIALDAAVAAIDIGLVMTLIGLDIALTGSPAGGVVVSLVGLTITAVGVGLLFVIPSMVPTVLGSSNPTAPPAPEDSTNFSQNQPQLRMEIELTVAPAPPPPPPPPPDDPTTNDDGSSDPTTDGESGADGGDSGDSGDF
jgi:hypothetical protein